MIDSVRERIWFALFCVALKLSGLSWLTIELAARANMAGDEADDPLFGWHIQSVGTIEIHDKGPQCYCARCWSEYPR